MINKEMNDMEKRQAPLAIDLFSGCGGLTEGLKQAGYTVLCAIENDQKACQNYQLNHPNVDLIASDIKAIDAIDVRSKLGLELGQLDLLAGCPPCQGFSTLKTRKKRPKRDERNSLIEDFLRFVLAFKPKNVMLENVPGLQRYYRFSKFVRSLREHGYHVDHKVLNVGDYGVPQRRQRLILIAGLEAKPSFAERSSSRLSVREVIGGLDAVELEKNDIHYIPERRTEKVIEIIKNIPKNGGSRSDLPEHLILDCHRKFSGYSDVYGRMSWENLAPTITSGCHNPSKGRFLHPEEDRTITLREAALLQGFPHTYKFLRETGKESLALMIGNALPPPFIKLHAEALKKGGING